MRSTRRPVRLVAATRDPATLDPASTWFLATALPREEARPEQVDERSRLRDGSAHEYQPVKHEVGWADYQLRPERAIVRHWQLGLLAFTCSVLVGVSPAPAAAAGAGGNRRARVRRAGRLERRAAPRPPGALPLADVAPAALVAAVDHRRTPTRAGRAPRPRRPIPPA